MHTALLVRRAPAPATASSTPPTSPARHRKGAAWRVLCAVCEGDRYWQRPPRAVSAAGERWVLLGLPSRALALERSQRQVMTPPRMRVATPHTRTPPPPRGARIGARARGAIFQRPPGDDDAASSSSVTEEEDDGAKPQGVRAKLSKLSAEVRCCRNWVVDVDEAGVEPVGYTGAGEGGHAGWRAAHVEGGAGVLAAGHGALRSRLQTRPASRAPGRARARPREVQYNTRAPWASLTSVPLHSLSLSPPLFWPLAGRGRRA
jgi:hypothetical protein